MHASAEAPRDRSHSSTISMIYETRATEARSAEYKKQKPQQHDQQLIMCKNQGLLGTHRMIEKMKRLVENSTNVKEK